MKTLTVFKSFFFVVFALSLSATNLMGKNNDNQPLKGIWLGKIEIPNSVVLRMAIVVDDESKAALNIIDQSTGNIPVDKVMIEGDSVSFLLEKLGIMISGNLNATKDSILSTFKQHGGEFALNMALVDELPKLKRPQTPKEPFGYKSEVIEFENASAGVHLAGTLTIPSSGYKVPAVVLLSGSGQQNRDMEFCGHQLFWVIADYLTNNGIAVLRMDDRGVGGSTGNFKSSTTGDFASDALAAVEILKNRNEIDADNIGLIGHSEGGATAVIAASKSSNVKFMIALSGEIINFGDIHIQQVTDQLRMQKVPEENIQLEKIWREKLNRIVREPIDSTEAAQKMWSAYKLLLPKEIKAMNWPEGRMNFMVGQLLSPWWRYSISLDVLSMYKNLNCPALLLFGEKDTQVYAADNMPAVQQVADENHRTNINIQLIDGVNHLFQTAETGSEYEYVQIEETISPEVLQIITSWILDNHNL